VSRFLRNKDYEIGTNQCHVTITDLAAEWHWHRDTVRSYLEKMEAFGLIQKITLPKSIVITIPESMSLSELKEEFSSLESSESEAQILDND
jgi:predicted transcriptional regulator